MEPAAKTPFLVPRQPAPPKTAQRWALWAILSLVTGGFAWDLYLARHSKHRLLLVVGDYCTTYAGLLLLHDCLRKHELLRGDPAAAATELRQVRRDPWVISLYLDWWLLFGVRREVPGLAPNLGLWPVATVAVLAVGLGLYFLVAARWPGPGEILHDSEVSPEHTV